MSTLNIRQFGKVVEYNIDNNLKRAILGLGAPGIGKSAVMAEIAKHRDMGLVDLRLLLFSETELKGIPFPSDDHISTLWLMNDIFPRVERDGERGILLIEEITSAPKRVQAAAYQLIHDRKLGSYVLPDGWFIVALGNREDDEGVYVQMPSPLANRFEIHEITYDLEIWKADFAYKKNVNQNIISYLNFKPSALHNFQPDTHSLSFATPRSWEAVSNIMNTEGADIEDDIIFSKISGNIGDIESNSFRQFCRMADSLISVDDILNGKSVTIPKEDEKVYILLGSIVSKLSFLKEQRDVSDAEKKKVVNVLEFLVKLKPEFTVVGFKDIVSLNPQKVKTIYMLETDDNKILEFYDEYSYLFKS